MFKLHIKLNHFKPEISRILYVPEDIEFSDLDNILRNIFNFSHYHLSIFEFDGLYTPMWDFEKTYPDQTSVDMNGTKISDYLSLIKKFSWTYDLNKAYLFNISVRKANKKYDTPYAFVESYKCEYNPLEDCHPADFEEMLYFTLENKKWPNYLPDFEMEKFTLDEVNKKLKSINLSDSDKE